MTSVNFNIQSVANVVHSWMSYIYEVSDTKHLAAESSLRYPIVGYFERCNNIKILMEEDLPSFSGKRVDFMWTEENKYKYYMEMKYIRDNSINVQGIYDDIFRLALIEDDNSMKYFMLCGNIDDFVAKIFKKERIPFYEEDGKIILNEHDNYTQKILCDILPFEINDEFKTNTFYAKKGNNFYSFVHNKKYYPKGKKMLAPKSIEIATKLVQPYSKGLKSAVAICEIRKISVN